jgi:hypothetical protein
MKIRCPKPASRQTKNGFTVAIVLVLLLIMVIFVAANTFTVNWLRKQVDFVDKKEVQRLRHSQSAANPPPAK